MRIYQLIIILLLNSPLGNAYSQNDCREIEKVTPGEIDSLVARTFTQPGRYCLTEDITSPRLYDIHGEKYNPGAAILRIETSDISIDLRKHSLIAEAGGSTGISVMATDYHGKLPSHVSIRNGIISARTETAIAFSFPGGSLLSDFKIIYAKNPSLAYDAYSKLQQTSSDTYPLTENTIEDVKIKANTGRSPARTGKLGISMKGRSNVIRNSTIEITDGQAALYLFGPNNIIENNIIVFRGESAFESAAAIKLHHGDGTIIRNNDIVIASGFGAAPKAAISLIDSKNVIVENNRVYGIKTLVKAWDEQSVVSERGNDFRDLLRSPSTAGKAGVH